MRRFWYVEANSFSPYLTSPRVSEALFFLIFPSLKSSLTVINGPDYPTYTAGALLTLQRHVWSGTCTHFP